MPEDPGGVAACDRKRGDVTGHYAAAGDNRVFADGDPCDDDGVGADPAIVFDGDERGRTRLITDGHIEIGITMVEAREDDVLGEYYVIAYADGGDQDIAEADGAIVAYLDIAEAIVETTEVLDDRGFADRTIIEGNKVEPGVAADDGSPSSFMDEGIDEGPHPPSGSRLALGEDRSQHEGFGAGV